MAPRPHRLVSLACVALAATVLTGCGAVLDTDTDEAGGQVPARHARPKKPSTHSPSPAAPDASMSSPAEDALGDEQAGSDGARVSLRERLLDADEMPVVTNDVAWTEASTATQEPEALAGTCHRFAMLSIGAMRVAYRDYAAADGSGARADELVASFADAKTAWRAFEVLKSWHEDCDETLSRWEHHEVGPLRTAIVDAGEAHVYLLRYGPTDGDADTFDAEGLVMAGSRIAVVRIVHPGQDPDAPDLEAPISAAVRAAAADLR